MASASSDSNVGLIGICGRKFSRILVLAGLFALFLTASGCGGDDDEEASTTPTATGPTETAMTEPVPTETEEDQPAVTEPEDRTETERETESPEDQPGGAGDEEPARTLALFTGRGGRITPRVIRVPAFISVRVELRSADGATYSLRFGATTIAAGERLNSQSTTIDGLRPGEGITGKPSGAGNPVRISATAEPGP
jgi:hypothetical protein